jgi:fluoroquinolone resistance protein
MIESETEYSNKHFTDLDYQNSEIHNSRFEHCSFINCIFDDSLIKKCRFVECHFKSCSINLVKLNGSSFVDTEFTDCKIKGINWTEITFPYVVLSSPLYFKACDISYSSFYELKLPGISIVDCKAHDADFRGADLTNADLTGTDFQNSEFNHTNLKSADFRQSINYRINPTENNISQAHFCLPEVIALLASFNIKIDDVE